MAKELDLYNCLKQLQKPSSRIMSEHLLEVMNNVGAMWLIMENSVVEMLMFP
jgi:hypothetical protein